MTSSSLHKAYGQPIALLICLLVMISVDILSMNAFSLAVANTPASEYQVLYDLYNATDGANWTWLTQNRSDVPWSFTDGSDPCKDKWQGVSCTVVGNVPNEQFHIQELRLTDNNMHGTVPTSIGDLPYLTGLDCSINHINGTLPTSILNLTLLTRIAFTYNNLTGTMLDFSPLTSLQYIALDYNLFTGHVPNIFHNFPDLTFLLLQTNHFSGPMPTMEGYFPRLVSLYLGYNHFTGTVSDAVGNISRLSFLDLDGNQFHGSIPQAYQNLTALVFFGVRDNQLTGTIPGYIGSWSRLNYLYIDTNYFSGPLPTTFQNLTDLRYLQAQYNDFTGPIPENFVHLRAMVYLYLDYNHLTGTVPQGINNIRFLSSIQLQNNMLSGTLEGVFDSSTQHHIETIQLSGNQFTGSLPAAIFQLPKLSNLVAVSNCFRGTLPSEMCDARALTTLALDGLRTASNCRQSIFPGLSSAYELSGDFGGTIPTCLFQLEFLNTLHLSGNGFTGSLPQNLVVSKSLVDLSLSHNILGGEIPMAIQERTWYNLDLSYNRFSGKLSSDFYSTTRNFTFDSTVDGLNGTQVLTTLHLYLENNRLSGKIPPNMRPIGNISVLAGNFYSCEYDKSDLPLHDDNRNSYQCGANSFNVPYYVWVCVMGVLVVCAVLLWRWRRRIDAYIGVTETVMRFGKWLEILDLLAERPAELQSRLMNISYISLVCDVICKVSMWCCLFTVVALIPFYITVSKIYGTHSEASTYTVSAIFSAGRVPFGVELALFCLLVGVMAFSFRYYILGFDHIHQTLLTDFSQQSTLIGNLARQEENTENDAFQQKEASKFERISVCVAFFFLSGTVVVGVNIMFVYVALYQSTVVLLIAQVLLSFFKVMWNLTAAPFLIQWTSNYLSSEATVDRKASRTGFFTLQLFVSLFNNIGIPCLVVMVIDPNCMYNVLVAARSETSSFVYEECEVYGLLTCFGLNPSISSSTYSPPFAYSYQCSSSFITYYAPTFLYVCFVATFISPMMQIVGYRLHRSIRKGTYFYRIVDYFLPPVFKPVDPTRLHIQREIFDPYFDANMVLISLLTYLGILLTFGAVFPPLAIALLVSILAVAYFERFKVGRFIHLVVEAGAYAYLDVIEIECQGMGSIRKLYQAVWMLSFFCFLFYSTFLFDTLGNAVGIGNAVWVFLAVPLAPVGFYIAVNVYHVYSKRFYGPKRTESEDLRLSAIELQAGHFDGAHGTDVEEAVEKTAEVENSTCEKGAAEAVAVRAVPVGVSPPAVAVDATAADTATEEPDVHEDHETFNVLQQRAAPSS